MNTHKLKVNISEDKIRAAALIFIFMLAAFARLRQFGAIPGGLNQDEAFAGYDAWALLHYGVDSSLHKYPVYLTAWGSGMNALESYLMIPFVALFGLKVWVIRLPQVIMGLLGVAAAYCVGKRISTRTGLLFAFLLAVSPWHIMLSRWALESNLAPGFLLFALLFFLKGLENGRYLYLSAVLYGLSLYSYATIWPVVPFIIAAQVVYAMRKGKLKAGRQLYISGGILLAFALPLLLFLAVNCGYIREIDLGLFSVPRLPVMRSGEISLRNIPDNLKNMWEILLSRGDGLIWNTPEKFGIYYPVSLLFAVIGLWESLRKLTGRRYAPEVFLLIGLAGGFVLSLLINVNVNRMNIIFMALIAFAAVGLDSVFGSLGKKAGIAVLAVYAALFISFEAYYFKDYPDAISADFRSGAGEAIETAMGYDGDIYVEGMYHSQILFYSRLSPYEYDRSVQYEHYPAAYLSAKKFWRFDLDFNADVPEDPEGVYVLWAGRDVSAYEEAGFTGTVCGNYRVMHR